MKLRPRLRWIEPVWLGKSAKICCASFGLPPAEVVAARRRVHPCPRDREGTAESVIIDEM